MKGRVKERNEQGIETQAKNRFSREKLETGVFSSFRGWRIVASLDISRFSHVRRKESEEKVVEWKYLFIIGDLLLYHVTSRNKNLYGPLHIE